MNTQPKVVDVRRISHVRWADPDRSSTWSRCGGRDTAAWLIDLDRTSGLYRDRGGSILVLSASVALRPDPKDLDEPPKPYAPKCPAQNLKRGDSMRSAGHPCGSISVAPQTSQNPADSQTHDVALHLVWKD